MDSVYTLEVELAGFANELGVRKRGEIPTFGSEWHEECKIIFRDEENRKSRFKGNKTKRIWF